MKSPLIAGRTTRSHAPAGTPGTATKLAYRTQPSGAVTGVALTQQPVIEVRDAFNSVVTGSTATVTLTIASGPDALSGTVAVAAVAGVATFTDIVLTGSGTDTLLASASGLTGAQSNPIVVSGGATFRITRASDFRTTRASDSRITR